MFGLHIFVRVQTFWRVPPVLPRNFCHPGINRTVHQYVRMISPILQLFLFSSFLFFRLFEAKFYLMETKQEGTDYALPQKEKKNVTVAFVLKSTGIDIIYHYIPQVQSRSSSVPLEV